jgi:hypothetical protein
MRPESLLIAQAALREDMADRQACCASSSQAQPRRQARPANRSALLLVMAQVLGRIRATLAKILEAGRAAPAGVTDSSAASDSAETGSRAA